MSRSVPIVLLTSTLLTAGCGYSHLPSAVEKQDAVGAKTASRPRTRPPIAPKLRYPSRKYAEWLTVDGKTVSASSRQGLDYEGLAIGLMVEGVSAIARYGTAVVGNHSQVLWSRQVTTKNGPTYEALSETTPPAASNAKLVQYHYWLVVYRDDSSATYPSFDLAYCVVGTPLDGTPSPADQAAMLSLLPGWQVPAARR